MMLSACSVLGTGDDARVHGDLCILCAASENSSSVHQITVILELYNYTVESALAIFVCAVCVCMCH